MRRVISFILVFVLLLSMSGVLVRAEPPAYSYKKNDGMKIALTFDDGPHPRYTVQILDILKRYGIKATFFTVGENAELYPEVLKRAVQEGHEIGNHTYTHPHIKGMDSKKLAEEVRRTEKAIETITGYKTTLFRPPEGVVDQAVKVMATTNDYRLVLWHVDTRDWAGTSTDGIYKKVIDNVRPGDIILMHDYLIKKCHTVEALELIIPKLIEEGYEFVTVSELIES